MIGSLRAKVQRFISQYHSDHQFGELIRTSFFALAVRLIGVGTGFFVTLITGRYFGANALGIVSICIAILSFASVFGKMGVDVAILKFISGFYSSDDKAGIKSTYISAMKIVVPVSVFISIVLFLSAPWMAENIFQKPYLTNILRFNAWITLPLVLVIMHAEAVRSLKRITAYTFLQTVSISSFSTMLLIVFYFIAPTLFVPAYIQFFSISITAVISILAWVRISGILNVKTSDAVTPGKLLHISSSMFTTTLMQLLMSWAGTLILASYSTEGDVGVYNAISRISILTNISILAINSLVQPRFAGHYAHGDFKQLKMESVQATRLIFLSTLPVFVVLALFPHFILSIFGRDFPGHETELYILLGTQFIVCFSGLPSQILNMTGRQHVLRNISLFSAIVNVSLCLILTAKFGLRGTCFAQLAGTFVWNTLSIAAVKKEFGFFTFFGKK